MSYIPVSGTVPQYEKEADGLPHNAAVLKGYKAGGSTPLQMATDAAGGTLVDDMPLNSNGNPTVSGVVQIPHFNEDYVLKLYPTQAAADADSGHTWTTLDMKAQALTWVKGADLASATELLVNVTGNQFDVTGTTTIATFESRGGNDIIVLHFDGALTLTHSASDLVLPDGVDILTEAGDIGMFYEYATGDYRCISWTGATGSVRLLEGADIASATTTEIWAKDGNTRHITGTTTITSLGTAPRAGSWQKVIFDGILTLTNGANLALPGGANITTAAGDFAFVYADTITQLDVLYFRKDGTPVVAGSAVGNIVQRVSNQTGAVATGTTVVTPDDSIPQITEGDEYMTQAITPTNTNNILEIQITAVFANSVASDTISVALFQDATAGALAAVMSDSVGANDPKVITFTHTMTAGTASSTTFRIREGAASGTNTFNGKAGLRILGGVIASSMIIREYKV